MGKSRFVVTIRDREEKTVTRLEMTDVRYEYSTVAEPIRMYGQFGTVAITRPSEDYGKVSLHGNYNSKTKTTISKKVKRARKSNRVQRRRRVG